MTNKCLIDDEQLTVAEFLQERRYHTAAFGNWHLSLTWFDKNGAWSELPNDREPI